MKYVLHMDDELMQEEALREGKGIRNYAPLSPFGKMKKKVIIRNDKTL